MILKGRRSVVFWSLSIAVLLFLLFLNEGVWRTFQRIREIHRLRRELAEAQGRLEETRRQIALLRSDQTYLDVLTHRELGYLSPDEIEIRFVKN